MTRTKSAVLAMVLTVAGAASLSAQAINNQATGLSGTFSTIDFNGLPYGNGTAITNQVPGVTFSPNLFYCAAAGCSGASFAPGYLANFTPGGGNMVDPFEIIFLSAVSRAAFQIQTNGGNAVNYSFWLGATNVGSYSNTRSCCGQAGDLLWNGWQNATFDRIRIQVGDGGDHAMAFDNLQYETNAVPEPASMVLLGTGLAGVAAARRRKKLAKSA